MVLNRPKRAASSGNGRTENRDYSRIERLESRRLLSGITLHTFSLPSGTSFPNHLTLGPDNNVWFTSGTPKVGKITPAGAVTVFNTTSAGNEGPSGMTLGPDGNLWFTDHFAQTVNKLTTTGHLTTFKLAGSFNSPDSITAGPDGNLWFVSFFNKIGRITTAGKVTYFNHTGPSMGKDVSYDGQIYFAEGSAIGRITTAGVYDGTFNLPSGGSIQDITPGADGNLWFTENRKTSSSPNNFVDFLTPGGKVTEFPISKTAGDLSGITLGGNGQMYVRQGDSLLAVSTAGKVTATQKLAFIAGGGSVVEGPGGNVYFGEGVLDKIGYAATAGTAKPAGFVTGNVFHDTNKNGLRDTGETAVANVRVWADVNHDGVFDTGDVSTLTDSAGNYQLALAPASFTISIASFTISIVAPTDLHITGLAHKTAAVKTEQITAAVNFGVA